MSKTPLVDKFIERYRRAAVFSADIALAIVLEQNAEHIEPLFEQRDPEWLHKAFRQTEVTESGKADMVIWHLIHAAPSFWESLQDFWAALEKRELKGRFNLLEQQHEELLAALEEARTGLAWYQETYPESANGSDDEAMKRIDAAIAKAKGGAA